MYARRKLVDGVSFPVYRLSRHLFPFLYNVYHGPRRTTAVRISAEGAATEMAKSMNSRARKRICGGEHVDNVSRQIYGSDAGTLGELKGWREGFTTVQHPKMTELNPAARLSLGLDMRHMRNVSEQSQQNDSNQRNQQQQQQPNRRLGSHFHLSFPLRFVASKLPGPSRNMTKPLFSGTCYAIKHDL